MPWLTGRENSVLLGALAGLSRDVARGALPQIEERSGLGSRFENLAGTFSPGMRARLGIAVVEQTAPEILLLDEVHEAIDETFRQELENLAIQVRRGGGIVVAAGHDQAMLGRLCDTTLLVEGAGVHRIPGLAQPGIPTG